MNALDLCLILLIAISIVTGVAKGFARSITGFVASTAGILCALWLYRSTGFFLRPYFHTRPSANLAGFLLVFLVIVIAGGILECRLGGLVRKSMLSSLDRLLGGLFGVVHGLFTATISVMLLVAFYPRLLDTTIAESRLMPFFENAAQVATEAAPDEIRDGFRAARRDIQRSDAPESVKRGLERL